MRPIVAFSVVMQNLNVDRFDESVRLQRKYFVIFGLEGNGKPAIFSGHSYQSSNFFHHEIV
jgi:hypothetical protein